MLFKNYFDLSEKKFLIFLFLTATAATSILFGHVLHFEFVFDDDYLILQNPFLQNWKNILLFFTHDVTQVTSIKISSGYYRPLSMLFLQMLYHAFGFASWKYHAVNLALQILNAFGVGLLARELRMSRLCAWISTLLFAIHPIHIEAFVPIYNYMGCLSALILMICTYFYLLAIKKNNLKFIFLSWFFYAIALLCKEDGLLLLIMLLFFEKTFYPENKKKFKQSCSHLSGFFVLAVIYLVARKNFIEPGAAFGFWGQKGGFNIDFGNTVFDWIMVTVRTYLFYLKLWIGSSPLGIYHWIPAPQNFSEWLSIFLELSLVLIAIKCLWKNTFIRVALVWFFVMQLLVSNAVPIGGMIGSRLAYIPSIGLCWATACIFDSVWKQSAATTKKFWVVFFILILSALGIRSYTYSQIWKSNFTLWRQAVEQHPDRAFPYPNLAKAAMEHGNFPMAAYCYQKEIDLLSKKIPPYEKWKRLAKVYGQAGQPEKAIWVFNAILKNYPFAWDSYFDLGWTYLMINRTEQAQAVYENLIQQNPHFAGGYAGLGEIALKKGRAEEALRNYQKALNSSPDLPLKQYVQGRISQLNSPQK